MATQAQRNGLASYMDHLYAQRAKVHYPIHDVRTRTIFQISSLAELNHELDSPHGFTIDCSQSVTLLCHLAGLKNPNTGTHVWESDGYTGTLLNALPHYTNPELANVGALVVFGPRHDGNHVAMVRHPGKNPVLFSHGQESDPRMISLQEEAKYHSGFITFLSIAGL